MKPKQKKIGIKWFVCENMMFYYGARCYFWGLYFAHTKNETMNVTKQTTNANGSCHSIRMGQAAKLITFEFLTIFRMITIFFPYRESGTKEMDMGKVFRVFSFPSKYICYSCCSLIASCFLLLMFI